MFRMLGFGSGLRYGIGAIPFSVDAHDERARHAVDGPSLLQRHADAGIGDLTRTALAAELADDLDGVHARRITRVAVGEQTAVGVHRHLAAEAHMAFLDVVGALAELAEAHLLEVADRGDAEAVVDAGDVDVVARHSRQLEGAFRRRAY